MTSHTPFPYKWHHEEERLDLPEAGAEFAPLIKELLVCIARVNFELYDIVECTHEGILRSQLTNKTESGKALIALLDKLVALKKAAEEGAFIQALRQGLETEIHTAKEKAVGLEEKLNKCELKCFREVGAMKEELEQVRATLARRCKKHDEDNDLNEKVARAQLEAEKHAVTALKTQLEHMTQSNVVLQKLLDTQQANYTEDLAAARKLLETERRTQSMKFEQMEAKLEEAYTEDRRSMRCMQSRLEEETKLRKKAERELKKAQGQKEADTASDDTEPVYVEDESE